MKRDLFLTTEKATEMDQPIRPDISETALKGVRSNIVQSIRAFRVQDLQDAARYRIGGYKGDAKTQFLLDRGLSVQTTLRDNEDKTKGAICAPLIDAQALAKPPKLRACASASPPNDTE